MTTTTLLLLGAIFFAGRSLSLSTTTQADLVFPRNNTVYKPSRNLPILLALHNFTTAWKFEPAAWWELSSFDEKAGEWRSNGGGVVGWDTFNDTKLGWPSPPDLALAVNVTESLDYRSEGRWSLKYGLSSAANACLDSADIWFPHGRIFFNTSNVTGIAPDLSTASSCALPIGALGFEGPNLTSNGSCVLFPKSQPAAVPCGIAVTPATADYITKAIDPAARWNGNCECVKTAPGPDVSVIGAGSGCEPCKKASGGSVLEIDSWVILSLLAGTFLWG